MAGSIASGALWIGTMGRKAEKGAGAIYHFGGGELRRLYASVSIPNAICFSPDGATAYFTDTKRRRSFIASRSILRTACRPATRRRCSTIAAGWAASTALWSMPKG